MKKGDINNKIENIKSDIQNPEISGPQKREKEDRLTELEEELEQINLGINATEEKLRELRGDEGTRKDLDDVADRASSLLEKLETEYEEIQEKEQETDYLLSELNEGEQKLEELEETAKGLLERTTSAALGKQFSERKVELENNLKYWKFASIGSILLLLFSAVVIYIDIIGSQASAVANLSKIALILPLSVAVWFSVSNYNRQTRLMEEYEFKARMALSLSGFREVLNEEVSEEDDEIVAEFLVDSMKNIHSNPQKNIQSANQDNQQNQDPLTTGQRPLVAMLERMGKN